MEEKQKKGYDYVEVMACPGGCVNGGGQLKPPALKDAEGYERDWSESGVETQLTKWGDREWTKKVEERYWQVPEVETTEADRWAHDIRSAFPTQLRTSYRAVESEVNGLTVKW